MSAVSPSSQHLIPGPAPAPHEPGGDSTFTPAPSRGPQYGASGSGGGGGATSFTSQQQTAFDIMEGMLEQYGLTSLSGELKQIILNGITDQTEISLQLQQTDAWKQRFAGNEILKQKGLPVLSVSQYLSVEQSYAQVMKNYGLPQGFYDDPSDFAKFIGNSVSANELQQRVQMYADIANREDPSVVQQLQSMGISKGDLLAHMMDPSRALPLIQKKYQETLIGAAARRTGLTPDNNYVSHLAELGISEQQATQGYGQVAQDLPGAQLLGSIYGEHVSQDELAQSVFEANSAGANKERRLASQERANFSGTSGVNPGSFNRSSSGSY